MSDHMGRSSRAVAISRRCRPRGLPSDRSRPSAGEPFFARTSSTGVSGRQRPPTSGRRRCSSRTRQVLARRGRARPKRDTVLVRRSLDAGGYSSSIDTESLTTAILLM